VVTEQLAKEFDKALRLVRGAVRKNTSYARLPARILRCR
jgi:hypothetical protein